MKAIYPKDYEHIVFFTGAGMSAESGVPTYRGRGGVWSQYRWEEYACQEAFDADPEKVLKFHELRRAAVLACKPHAGRRGHRGVGEETSAGDGGDAEHRRDAPAGGKAGTSSSCTGASGACGARTTASRKI